MRAVVGIVFRRFRFVIVIRIAGFVFAAGMGRMSRQSMSRFSRGGGFHADAEQGSQQIHWQQECGEENVTQ